MSRLIRKILQLLDGTPTVYGKRQSGQSLVEMALITPILIIMFMGMVEIGWFANNYLTLLDVSRAGARRGAVLQDQFSPLEWEDSALTSSYVPVEMIQDNDYSGQGLQVVGSAVLAMPYTGNAAEQDAQRSARNAQRSCLNANRLFYLEISCVMLASMEPLRFDEDNNVDDIVISGFSLARITDPAGGTTILGPNVPATRTAGVDTYMVVVGRYPSNANECNVRNTVSDPAQPPIFAVHTFERDPFDVDQDNGRDIIAGMTGGPASGGQLTERAGYDAIGGTVAAAEKQVGYVWFGNHWIQGTGCLGSEFTVAEVETLVNLPNYQMTNEDRRRNLPHQGLVLVELFWEHEMLLKFPVFNPVVNAFAGDLTPTVSVWAAFPMPSVEPTNSSLGF